MPPPSLRRQDWTVIAVMSGSVFISSLLLLTYFTWPLGSDWGDFPDHWPFFQDAAIEALLGKSPHEWELYWSQISEYGLEVHFVLHVGIPILCACGLAALTGCLFYVPGGQDRLCHVAGGQLYWHSRAVRHSKQKARREKGLPGLALHPKIQISRARESGNIFVVGAQSSGKTVFITPLIQQVIARKSHTFIYDEKREFTSLFFDQSQAILIAPWDARGTPWNICEDAKDAASAQLIAERLIAETKDPLWSSGARMIFAGMIGILNSTREKWGWSQLAEVLSSSEIELAELLALHYPRAARFIAENSRTTHSFFAQLLGSLGWIYTLAEAWPEASENGFSISKWCLDHNPKRKVLLVQADKRYRDIGAPVANALIALMTSFVLSLGNSNEREYWLFLDELANLPRNDSLAEWMSLGRSKGCRTVAGTQSVSQVQNIYSDSGADSLLSMFTLFISMRVGGAGRTAKFASESFGEREVERPSVVPGGQDGVTVNWQRESVPVVTASELVHLPQASKNGVEGYMLIPGWEAVYRLRWPFPNVPQIAPEHCPAEWLVGGQKSDVKGKTAAKKQSRREQFRSKRRAVNERNK